MSQLRLKLLRDGVPLRMVGAALNRLEEGSELRRAFAQACMSGLDANSPHAEAVRELIESYGWKWKLWERPCQ